MADSFERLRAIGVLREPPQAEDDRVTHPGIASTSSTPRDNAQTNVERTTLGIRGLAAAAVNPKNRDTAVAVGLAIVSVVVIAFVASSMIRELSAPPKPAAAASALPSGVDLVQALGDSRLETNPVSVPVVALKTAVPVPVPVPAPVAPRRVAAAPSAPRPAAPQVSSGASVPARTSSPTVVVPAPAPAGARSTANTASVPVLPVVLPEPSAIPPETPIYDVSNSEVTPPRVLRPQLLSILRPTNAEVRLDALMITLVVNADGKVDSVRGITEPQNMAEFLQLTSALSVVKTWEFQPATRNGKPVAFREVIPLKVMLAETP